LAERSLQAFYPELSRLGAEEDLAQGALLFREGDPGDSVVLLLDGELEIFKEPSEGEEVTLRVVHAGATVGEMAADGGRRSANVRARTPCRLVRVPAHAFRALLRSRPDILEELYWQQVDRVRDLTRQVTRTHRRAVTDPLTRLYNFGFFRERLALELERARETGDPVSLVMFDIDHFKHYNDSNGHQEGNAVLATVSEIIRRTGRRGDVMARYGGEEFVALLYGATRAEAAHFASLVREAVEAQPFAGGAHQPDGRVTLSGGIATFPEDADGEDALIAAADANLYRAKDGGRNRVVSESRAG
jgi:diguanylate cyclase (GGDEF)-like protein